MTNVSDVDALENEVFKCTFTNSTRRSLEFLLAKVARLEILSTDTPAIEKQNRMKVHLDGLLEKIEPKDNYRFNYHVSWTGIMIGFIAACIIFLLIMALR